MNTATFECRCCGRINWGFHDGTFGFDPRGQWRRVGNIDGPNAVCAQCAASPDVLERFVEDGYEHAVLAPGESF